MAAKGSIAKEQVIQKILESFPDSFTYNDGKEVRINCDENGVPVQIKLTLTCAKNAVTSELKKKESDNYDLDFSDDTYAPANPQEPTEEEKARITQLLENLNLQ